MPQWRSDTDFIHQVDHLFSLLTEDHGHNTVGWTARVNVARDQFNARCTDPEKRHIVCGVIESELGNWKAARDEFHLAIQGAPHSSAGYLFHAIAAYHCDDLVACAASATTFLELNPQSGLASLLLLDCSLALREFRAAYDAIISLCDSDPGNPYYYTRFRELTFLLVEENESLRAIIRRQEDEIRALKAENAALAAENEALRDRITALEARNRHMRYALDHPRRSTIDLIGFAATIAGLLTPYKPLQVLCAAISLASQL